MRPALARIVPAGLRWRLVAWVAVVMLICTGIIFVAVYRGTGTQLRHQIDQETAGDTGEFAHNLALTDTRSPRRLAEAATRYVHDQPFSASSTLLFCVVPGAATSTNRPELFGDATPDNGETAAEQAQENRLSTQLLTVHAGYSTLVLPDVAGNLRLLKRVVAARRSPEGGARIEIELPHFTPSPRRASSTMSGAPSGAPLSTSSSESEALKEGEQPEAVIIRLSPS
jgi:hypothetical protein